MAAIVSDVQFLCAQQPFKPTRKSSSKLGSAFRKVGRYFQDQAKVQSNSHSALYLSPTSRGIQIDSRKDTSLGDDDEGEILLARKLTVLNGADNLLPLFLSPSPEQPTPNIRSSGRKSMAATTSSRSSASGPGIFQTMVRHQYGLDNILQSYDVLIPEHTTNTNTSTNRYWLVYIHGGYFRDPKVDSTSLKPTISLIEESNPTFPSSSARLKDSIAGYASLNYRLAPHTGYPQDPSKTPAYMLNNARWPDQPHDILAALRHLQRTYPASREQYILIGHSVGATLAFLAAMQYSTSSTITSGYGGGIDGDGKIAPPVAVVGVSGIYDFPRIHTTNPGYEPITRNGMDQRYYAEASPALYTVGEYERQWLGEREQEQGGLVLLAHSRDDGLVGWEQVTEMEGVFDDRGGSKSERIKCEMLELHGEHNEIWEKGGELVRTIDKVVELLR